MTDQGIAKLDEFFLATAANGYANANVPTATQADGSHQLVLEHGEYTMQDNWFGGEPFGGREVVEKAGKAVWMMVYYGAIEDTNEKLEDVYSALREALAQPTKALPVRGPESLEARNGYTYEFNWTGNIDRFRGHELIRNPSNKVVYQCDVSGGVVDL